MAYTKTTWQDLPNTTTPITATRLNNIENGIKENDDKLLGDKVMGDVVVNSVKTKNLFDKNTLVQGDISNGYPTIRLSSRQALWLEAGTYTFSTNMPNSYNYNLIVENEGVPPLSSQPSFIYTSGWVSSASTTFTINNAGWFLIYLRRSDNGTFTSTDITNLAGYNYQLETGSTATPITAYQNLTGLDPYTTGEQRIGTWIDGKRLYRRVLNIPSTSISSSSTTIIDLSVGSINVKNFSGYVNVGTSNFNYPISGYRGLDYGIRQHIANNRLQLIVGTSLSAERTISGTVIIEYTKN